jgi:hypothetical protein
LASRTFERSTEGVLVDALTPAQFSDAVLTAQPVKDNPDLLF